MHHRQDAHQKGSDNSASARVSNQFQLRPFGLQAQSVPATPQQQETPDLQTQLERAKRFGPDFSRVRVRGEGPPPTIQPKPFFGEHRDQEETVTDSMALHVTSMLAPTVNLRPIPRQDAESVGNQPNPLAARMMPPIPRRDADLVGNQPNPLAARMMPVLQRQPQPIVSIQRQPWIQRIEQQPEAKLEQEDESAPLQAKLENATVQRQSEANEEEEAENSLPVQAKLENATVQRQSEGEQESENEDHSMQLVQPKLTIGAPGDKYEIEADSMAERVMSMNVPDAPAAIQRSEAGEEDALQKQPLADSITPLIQCQSEEEEDIQTKPSVQRAGQDGGVQASSSIENTLASQKGGGSPLDEEVRSFMEPRFGNDFSSVRIHTGSNAVQMNKELHAQAFAHGKDIYFNEGKYNPGSDQGKRLLAHELTHVVQQTGAVQPKSGKGFAAKENKVQLKASPAPSNDASETIQLKGNPQEQAGGENKVEPAQPAAAASPAGQKGAPAKTQTGEGGGVAAKKDGGGAAPAKVGVGKVETNLGGGAPAAQGGTKQAASGGGSSSASGGGGAKSAQDDPAFQAVVNKTKKVASSEKKHEPAAAKSKQAQAAAEPPSNDVESKAQDKQVAEMNQQQPGQFNAATFKAALMEKIAAVTPQTLEEADNFKNNNKIDSVKGELSSSVTDEKKQASGPIEEKTKEQPDPSGIAPKPVTPLPPEKAGSPPSDIGAEKAAPKPKPASEVSLQEGSKSLDQQMSEANVSEEQLASSNEPQFKSALTAKKTAQTDTKTAPQGYRQQEQGILKQAQTEAQTTAQTQLQGMHGDREQLLAGVVGLQGEAKGQDEQKRTQVANHLGAIYNTTKQKVEATLSQLDGEVNKQFDSGAATAKTQFENYVDQRMKRYKEERYSGATGFLKWGKDKLFGMPSEVNVFYQEGRDVYLSSMGKAIDNIATFVAKTLNVAKAEIAKGRQEIQKYVAGLDPSLRQVGQEAAQDIGSKFDELEQNVDNKQNELVDSLAQKYNENLQQIDSRIDEMKAANRGLVNKAMDAVGGAIKTILELKSLLMGVLAKAAGAIEKIIKDPIGFLGNLVSGLKQGFQNFMGNILEHLKKGMLGWLTGAMAGAGITMPESLDMKGIFSLVTQVLGTVYENIRPRAVKRMGEKSVNFLESNFEMFVILKNEGIAGLWQSIQDQIGDLKVMVIDNIQNFVVDGIIKGGVMWVLSLLNPASAFVKACKAIYDIIMFFIERGSQIAELVNAVMESVTAIASGAVGGAAKLVENALSKALPVVISFMASLLGLGGISEKIQAIVQKVRGPIEKAIDWVIGQAVKFAKKIGGKLGFWKDKNKAGKNDKTNQNNKAGDHWNVEKSFKLKSGQAHELSFKGRGEEAKVYLASDSPGPLHQKIKKVLDRQDNSVTIKNPSKLDSALTKAKGLYKRISEYEKANANTETESIRETIDEHLTNIKNDLIEGIDGMDDLPLTNVTYTTQAGKSYKVVARPLTLEPGNTLGQTADAFSGELAGWKLAKLINDTTLNEEGKPSYPWEKVHLLSAAFHGPATNWNLVTGRKAFNRFMNTVETKVKKALGDKKDNKVLYYEVQVDYHDSGSIATDKVEDEQAKSIIAQSNANHYPVAVKGKWGELDPKTEEPFDNSEQARFELPMPTQENAPEVLKQRLIVRAEAIAKEESIKTPTEIAKRLHLYSEGRYPFLKDDERKKIVDEAFAKAGKSLPIDAPAAILKYLNDSQHNLAVSRTDMKNNITSTYPHITQDAFDKAIARLEDEGKITVDRTNRYNNQITLK